MTPPIHDREQAVQTVAALLHGDALNVRLVAGRIVDALGIGTTDYEGGDAHAAGFLSTDVAGAGDGCLGTREEIEPGHSVPGQPDPQTARPDGWRRERDRALERAERAEERLRAVTGAALNVDRAHESFRSSLPYQPPEAVYALYREKLALPLDALRAVLSEQEGRNEP